MADHAGSSSSTSARSTSRCATSASTPSWYLTGYPVGGEVRRRFAQVSSLAELDDLLGELDPAMTIVPGGERIRRGHTNGPIRVASRTATSTTSTTTSRPDDDDVMALSGG